MKCIGFFNKDSGNQDLSSSDIIMSNMSDIDYEFINKIVNIDN
nr:hypothetical protein [[Clostridium] dakarense]